MKRLFNIFIFTFILLLVGCDKTGSVAEKPEQLTLMVSPTALTKAETTADPLPNDLNIGIYVQQKDVEQEAPPIARNKKHTSKEGLLLSEDNAGILVTAGKNYFVYGYSPYKNFVEGGHTAIPFIHGEDVLLSAVDSITDVSSDRNSVSLTFEHKTAQIQFKVQVKSPDETLTDNGVLEDTSIEVTGFASGATLDLVTGVLTPNADLTAKIASSSKSISDKFVLETPPTSFFYPANCKKTLYIKISHRGEESAKVPFSREDWTAGSSYVYTITINEKNSAVEIQISDNVQIKDWVVIKDEGVLVI